jgi:hypothetical protein
MNLRLVSSSDDRALSIRDHLVRLVRDRGRQEVQRDSVRLISFQTGPFTLAHWTPFNELGAKERRPHRATGTPLRGSKQRRACPTELTFGTTGRKS